MSSTLAEDGLPATLFRAFSEKAHLDAFVAGQILVRQLEAFRTIEDATRRDDREGESNLLVDGVASSHLNMMGSFHGPTYVLCCSAASTHEALMAFGPWRARISEPTGLLRALGQAANVALPGRELVQALLLKVRYSKGTKSATTPPAEERYRLMLAQKPERFCSEMEWRFVLILSGPTEGTPPLLSLRVHDPTSLISVGEGTE